MKVRKTNYGKNGKSDLIEPERHNGQRLEEFAAYTVILEWDGEKPPSTWYRRLAKLALSRGNKDTLLGDENEDSPIARRQSRNGTSRGVMLQEGAFLCDSESLAYTIANYALNGIETVDRVTEEIKIIRPAHVMIGRVEALNPIAISDADREAIDRINQVYGRRGKPLPSTYWSVTCYECLQTHAVYAPAVAVCPKCHGTRIDVQAGTPVQYDLKPLEGRFTEFQVWAITRFGATGRMQLPASSGRLVAPPNPHLFGGPRDLSPQESAAYCAVEHPRMPLCAPDVEGTLALMDAAYIARTRFTHQKRLEARVEALTKFIQMGGEASQIAHLFAEDSAHCDILDAALLLGARYIATLLLHQTKGVL